MLLQDAQGPTIISREVLELLLHAAPTKGISFHGNFGDSTVGTLPKWIATCRRSLTCHTTKDSTTAVPAHVVSECPSPLSHLHPRPHSNGWSRLHHNREYANLRQHLRF